MTPLEAACRAFLEHDNVQVNDKGENWRDIAPQMRAALLIALERWKITECERNKAIIALITERYEIRSALAKTSTERDALREALEPFAWEANQWPDDIKDDWRICKSKATPITVGNLRSARTALKFMEGGQ